MTDERLVRTLATAIDGLASARTPDYLEAAIERASSGPQRPAWTFPERWLPMDIVTQRVVAPALPWRQLAGLALIALLIASAIAAYVGAQPRLPAPFGQARNGLVAYETGGDIYTADPVTGTATPIVTGPETDVGPRYSLDGTHIVFQRETGAGHVELYVARSDGSQIVKVTTEPIVLGRNIDNEPNQYQFSPDGRSVLIWTVRGISIAQSDGSGIRRLDLATTAYEPSFRPPNGAEILFVGNRGVPGLFAVDPSNGVVRTIVEASAGFDIGGPRWSPDGSQIAYHSWGGPGEGLTARTHVISADGTMDRELPVPPAAVWNASPEWSNDGSRLFIVRGYTPFFEDVRGVVIPADGGGLGVEIPYPGLLNGECCSSWEWSPDDAMILGTPTDTTGQPTQQVILDPATGGSREAPWTTTSRPTWQRLAP